MLRHLRPPAHAPAARPGLGVPPPHPSYIYILHIHIHIYSYIYNFNKNIRSHFCSSADPGQGRHPTRPAA